MPCFVKQHTSCTHPDVCIHCSLPGILSAPLFSLYPYTTTSEQLAQSPKLNSFRMPPQTLLRPTSEFRCHSLCCPSNHLLHLRYKYNICMLVCFITRMGVLRAGTIAYLSLYPQVPGTLAKTLQLNKWGGEERKGENQRKRKTADIFGC